MRERPDTADYRALFLADAPLADLRSPGEFAQGAFPGSLSLPLMTDGERAEVGTCYKRSGQQAAIELGHRLVCGQTRAERLARWADFARHHPDGYLYCFRGGLRLWWRFFGSRLAGRAQQHRHGQCDYRASVFHRLSG